MSIDAIGALSGIGGTSGIAGLGGVSGIDSAAGTAATTGTGGSDFAAQLGAGLDKLQGVQDKADTLAVQAATGQLTDVHDYIIASTEASLATQLTVAVRNKALEAFNEIMRMQA